MTKNAIQKFAIWARKELITQVSQRAYQYGIDESGFGDASADTLNGRLLTAEEKSQRQDLIKQIKEKGYKQIMEEVAYTWFNRFIALRFMEVNNYLPSHIRVFSDASGAFKPEILNDVLHLDLPGLDSGKVAEYIESNDTEALYRYLLLTQCNALNSALPVMFERMGGYTEMLLPNNILRQDSVLGHMVSDIPEEDWQDAVQIIGWLYQYYNTELKDDTFAQLKKNVKITKERIPAATQLFTPDWIVRYMVENSLGRIYIDKRKNEGVFADGRGLDEMTWHEVELKRIANEKYIADQMGWKYYIPEAEQTPEVRRQMDEIEKKYCQLKPEEIKVIDPCMGSGHILVYAFDVLMQIYTSVGWGQREAAQSILKNNLYGLDIDKRAAQLAYFSVMMKARQYDRKLLTRDIQPNIYSVHESNRITMESLHDMGVELPQEDRDTAVEQIMRLIDELRDAKEYGSILTVTPCDWNLLRRFAVAKTEDEDGQQLMGIDGEQTTASLLQKLIDVGEVLSQKYDVVVTNPPYRGVADIAPQLQEFVKKHYPNSCSDLSTVFMEHCIDMTKAQGYVAMINIPVWMSLVSYKELREGLLNTSTIINMLHLGRGMFGSDFGTTAFVLSNGSMPEYISTYKKFFIKQAAVESEEAKRKLFFGGTKDYHTKQEVYRHLPNSIIAYWATQSFANAFETGEKINSFAVVFEGLKTRDKDRFLRMWYEVANAKWKPYAKGGAFRKWYGNNEYVVNWGDNGDEVRNFKKSSGANFSHYFEPAITYTAMTMSKFTGRYIENQIFGGGGGGITASQDNVFYLLCFVNSAVYDYIISAMKSTVNFEVGQIGSVPVLFGSTENTTQLNQLAQENVSSSKQDWDSYETSWDFKRSPLI